MIDLYTWHSTNGRRASIILAESGLEHRIKKVNFATETKDPKFLALNPAGQIPVLVDHDGPGGEPVTIAQSAAIALYIAEKSGKLLPRDGARRAAALQWLMVAASDVSAANTAVYFIENETAEKPESILQFFKDRLVRFFSLIDHRLRDREFLADELSIADLVLYPNYFQRKALLDTRSGLANLHRWGALLGARPGLAKAMNQ